MSSPRLALLAVAAKLRAETWLDAIQRDQGGSDAAMAALTDARDAMLAKRPAPAEANTPLMLPKSIEILPSEHGWHVWCWTAPKGTALEDVLGGRWLEAKLRHIKPLDEVRVVEANARWVARGLIVAIEPDSKLPSIKWLDIIDASALPAIGPDWSKAEIVETGETWSVKLNGKAVRSFASKPMCEAYLKLKADMAKEL